MVNWEFFDNQTPSSACDLVDELRAGEPPVPTRGAPLCTFRQTARTLAGLPDSRPSGTEVGDATLAGLRVAEALGMTAPDAPAPAPSATVPPKSSTPDTKPKATDSDK